MDAAMWIVCGIMAAVVIALVLASDYLERRYYIKHPPDDGTREEWFDDDDR